MLHTLIAKAVAPLNIAEVSAHCDIPCKIYDPAAAQVAALTLIRMIDLIEEVGNKAPLNIHDQAQLVRLINEKEAHGLTVKQEVHIIWGDYFKQAQFDQVPDIHDLVHNIMLQTSKAKQGLQRADGLALLQLVNQFAEAFWTTKGVATYTAICPYLPSEAVVYPKLEAL